MHDSSGFPSRAFQNKAPSDFVAPDKFDEWGDVPFPDEMIHLDKIAKQLKEWRLSIVYLAIHAGKGLVREKPKHEVYVLRITL